jgi:hypothetical protein
MNTWLLMVVLSKIVWNVKVVRSQLLRKLVMKKFKLKHKFILTLILLSNSVMANSSWFYYGSQNSSNGRVDYFYDEDIYGPKNKRKMWLLSDYENPREQSGVRYYSMRSLAIFDCNSRSYTFGQISYHSEKGAKGDTLVMHTYSEKEQEDKKIDIAPTSLMNNFYKIGCK